MPTTLVETALFCVGGDQPAEVTAVGWAGTSSLGIGGDQSMPDEEFYGQG